MSELQYISDSDGDNSLPQLPESAIDMSLLNDFYSFLSGSSKERLRIEVRNTLLSLLFNHLDNDFKDANPNSSQLLPSPTRTELPSTLQTEPNKLDQISAAAHAPNDSSMTSLKTSSTETAFRSLRKRNFSSRHPYIADQADWLGICTIDSINEMFTADEDLQKVVRALNTLYLKRKKRYPDEDRYKAKNFYAHLGQNKLLALQGDPDAKPASKSDNESLLVLEENDDTLQNEEMDHDHEEDDDDEDLIRLEDIQVPPVPSKQRHTHSYQHPTYESAEDTETSVSDENDDYEDEYVRVGGRFRKLKTILRGVLPESAKRLDYFKHDLRKTKRRKIPQRELEPRKGLAIRKIPSISKKSNQEGLKSFVNDEESKEEYTPNYLRISHSPTASFEDLRAFRSTYINSNSDSGSGSDSNHEVFTDLESTPMRNLTLNSNPNEITLVTSGSESIEEEDHIDYMFASKGTTKVAKPRQKGLHQRHIKTSPFTERSFTNMHSPYQSVSLSGKRLKSAVIGRRTNKLRKKRRPQLSQQGFEHTNKNTYPQKDALTAQHNANSVTHNLLPATEKEEGEGKLNEKTQVFHPIAPFFRRDPVMSTTAFEVESDSKFIRERNVRPSSHALSFLHRPQSIPENSYALIPLAPIDIPRIHTIGDGHIFCASENAVTISLVEKKYSLGLYKLDSSIRETEKYFVQLRTLLLNTNMLSNPILRTDIKISLQRMTKWILIVREGIPNTILKQLQLTLDVLAKMHTKKIRLYLSVFHAQLLFILFIAIKLDSGLQQSEKLKEIDDYCTEYWSMFFLAISISDINKLCDDDGTNSSLFDSIQLIHFLYVGRTCSWWVPITESLKEIGFFNEENASLLDSLYVLASWFPRESDWSPFLIIFEKFKNAKVSVDHHHFLDICELAIEKLEWPIEERLIIHLYSSYGKRKFGNFADETVVPRPLHYVYSKHDIPKTTVFERFLRLVYTYVSQLESKKSIKRLVSKLVASSQYHYQKGRRYQIMFVNRINLISLLCQISEVDLKNQLSNLVEQVRDSRDMFVFGMAVSAIQLQCDVAHKKSFFMPWSGIQCLLESFCTYYDSLFGLPSLFQSFVNYIGSKLISMQSCKEIILFFKLCERCSLDKFPDPILIDVLKFMASIDFESLASSTEFVTNYEKDFVEFQKYLLMFLSTEMLRLPVSQERFQIKIDQIVEQTIKIWFLISKCTNTCNWNIVMLQKYSYLGNAFLRDRYLMFMCIQFASNHTLTSYEITEIDIILLKSLLAFDLSTYTPHLLNILSKRNGSVFNFKRILLGDFQSVTQVLATRVQILSLVIQSVCSLSFDEREQREYLLVLVKRLQDEYSIHFRNHTFKDFCKRTMELLLRFSQDKLDGLDDIWNFAAKLGFPRRKNKELWKNVSEQERLQKVNNEFIDALHYNRDYHMVLDELLAPDDIDTIYSLIQVYVEAVTINTDYWAQLSYLLKYLLVKLSRFQVETQDNKFKIFLDFLCDLSLVSCRWKNKNLVIFELESLTTASHILHKAYYIYQGYKDRREIISYIHDFLTMIDQCSLKFQSRNLFTEITFGMLRSVSHPNFNLNFQHSEEEYKAAYKRQDELMLALRGLVKTTEKREFDTEISTDFEFRL